MNTMESLDHNFVTVTETLKSASRKRRIVAFIIDHITLSFLMVALAFLVLGTRFMEGDGGEPPIEMMLVAMIPGMLLYFVKDSFNGVSFGKWVMGIMVRDANDFNVTPSFIRLFVRNLFLMIWPIEFIVLATSKAKQRLGDQVAKTVVLANPNKAGKVPRIASFVAIAFILFSSTVVLTSLVMKNSDAYKVAIQHIESDPDIVAKTGGIKGYGTIPKGNINVSNGNGEAHLQIDVLGQTKDMVISIHLAKEPDGEWEVLQMDKW